MTDTTTTEQVAATTAALRGPVGGRVLDAVLHADGGEVHDWHVRSVHRRGSASAAVVYRVDLTDGNGQRRDRLYVAHASTHPVPPGAATVGVDGTTVHVWQFPHDPYLPGLRTAVSLAAAADLLRDVGHTADERPQIRTRSYRPTRRAVVALTPGTASAPAVYVKLLGGRDPHQVRSRAAALVTVHDRLRAAGLPVPRVLDHDAASGRVVLDAVPGSTLREVVRDGSAPPEPAAVAGLLEQFRVAPALPGDGDPDGFADVTRHVRLLRAQLPARTDDLDRLEAVAGTVGGPVGTVHGDLHDGQLIVRDGAIHGVLDVDGAGTGHVAHDAGRLLAGVEALTLTGDAATAARATAYLARLGPAVGEVAGQRHLAAAAAAAWTGLATGPLRVASPTWRSEAGARLDRAVAWAEQTDA